MQKRDDQTINLDRFDSIKKICIFANTELMKSNLNPLADIKTWGLCEIKSTFCWSRLERNILEIS